MRGYGRELTTLPVDEIVPPAGGSCPESETPAPGSRWQAADNVVGGGTTLTVQRVVRPFPPAIRSPYVECWVAGELRRIPLDDRWGRGLVPIKDSSPVNSGERVRA